MTTRANCRQTSSSTTAFKLSRVYAEGWNAAKGISVLESADDHQARVAALNPYTAEPERSRWGEGFSKALGH